MRESYYIEIKREIKNRRRTKTKIRNTIKEQEDYEQEEEE